MAEKIFAEQLDNQYVDSWADKGGVGLADMIYTQIKEKYFGTAKRDFSQPRGALPIKVPQGAPSGGLHQDESDPVADGRAHGVPFRRAGPVWAEFQAQAPFAGAVVEAGPLGDGWNLVRLDHGRGFHSEMTFPGRLTEMGQGLDVQPGQRLGVLDPGRPVLDLEIGLE
ncbi:MAG: hypothetical protein HC902_13585 [Calothrix sp. SM1_5_4]|nr:hypothetical protein [Calothrix sp. SM1_5_4]